MRGSTERRVNLGERSRGESIGQMGGQNYLGAKLRLFQLFGEALGKALLSLVKQALDIRRRVRAVVAREERQHGHTWLF